MCDPLTIAAGAMMFGSAYANNRAQSQVQKANLNVRRAEDARQAGYRQQAELAYAKNKDLFDPGKAQGEMKSSAKERTDAYTKANMAAPRAAAAASSASMGGNRVVQEANAARLADATSRASAHGAAGAELMSLGDMLFGADLARGRNRDDINMSANFARGSLRPLDAELEAAAHKGDKMRMLGTLLGAGGSALMAGAGAKGAGTGAAGAAEASTNIGPFLPNMGGYSLPAGAGYFMPGQVNSYGARLPYFGPN